LRFCEWIQKIKPKRKEQVPKGKLSTKEKGTSTKRETINKREGNKYQKGNYHSTLRKGTQPGKGCGGLLKHGLVAEQYLTYPNSKPKLIKKIRGLYPYLRDRRYCDQKHLKYEVCRRPL
jgi:hypothetical protein